MRDTWIDDHTGDETVARPDFKAELRSQLANELVAPARRQAPWRAIGWASVAAAAAVAGVVVLNGDDKGRTVVPVATTAPSVPTTDPVTPTSNPGTTEVPQGNGLQVPASGGPVLAPAVLAELDIAEGGSPFHVALLPDRIVVALVVDGRFDGTIVSFDRSGSRLPDTRLDAAPSDFAGLVLGGYDGTLYLETFPEVANTQTTKAYTLDGDVWREVASYFVEQNNDASYSVSGEGLMLGATLVIPAQTVAETPELSLRYPGTGPAVFQVLRTDGAGTTSWMVSEDFENFSLPPVPSPYAGGVIFEGNGSGDPGQQYVAVLRNGSPSEFFRPDGWRLVSSDEATALFAQVVDGTLRIGAFTGASTSPELLADWSTGTVLGLPLGFSSVDKVLTGINPVLGEPTADSGWFVVEAIAPGDEDCLAGQELRVLHWGDLTVAFKSGFTPDGLEGEQMWSWVVGDLRASGFSSFREPVPAPTAPPTGLLTEDGFGLGTTVDELRASGEVVLSDFTNDDGTRNGFFTPTDGTESGLNRSIVIDADGNVIGFGTTQAFC